MRAGTAQEQARHRCPVLRRAWHRPDHEELIETELAVVPVSTAHPELLLEIPRCQQFDRADP
jgi:hypothetical protein